MLSSYVKDFSTHLTLLTMSRLGVDRTKTADPNCPKQYSTLYGVHPAIKAVVKKEEGVDAGSVGPRICPAFLGVAALPAC